MKQQLRSNAPGSRSQRSLRTAEDEISQFSGDTLEIVVIVAAAVSSVSFVSSAAKGQFTSLLLVAAIGATHVKTWRQGVLMDCALMFYADEM